MPPQSDINDDGLGDRQSRRSFTDVLRCAFDERYKAGKRDRRNKLFEANSGSILKEKRFLLNIDLGDTMAEMLISQGYEFVEIRNESPMGRITKFVDVMKIG